ncbi:arsenic resistance N-acetyltransferase ArsN2 [Piscinibacter sp. HJYY11]|uniref:arsenic resistance N-acetyltransferase ArsN2 n=1 Tax=Piscinibacter sp. HJYY11 TaxID=2801333 RepID=UPI00191D74CC|nr:arsenic resistance N-acetyltransferase ArsN2 [Piscinibacter sp. HJYY11]MBL0727304.1 GNAT family N-acetyltransferase [Piscinibacter sp. HJYY11]
MLTSTVSLRQAGTADWPAISALLRANKLPLDGAEQHLQTFVVAHQGTEVIGVAGAEVYGDVALLRSVAVAPGLHRQGVGRLLVSTVLDQARRRGIRQVFLLTTSAPDYFQGFGFSRVARDRAHQALKASAEFQGACPDSAALMALTLHATRQPDGTLPVAVIGAGPVGLAAAARLIERGMPLIVLEAGAGVGASLVDYGHVRLFSPWRYNIDAAMSALLEPTGWAPPALDDAPLAHEIVDRLLKPFAALPQVAEALHLNTRVQSISREGFDKVKSVGREAAAFVIRAWQNGHSIEFRARAVIDATGTWSTPNPLGANGLPAIGEAELADRIFYGIPDVLGRDRARYAGKRTLVVGAGHSAANALLGLAELSNAVPGTRLAWSVRTPSLTRVFGGGAADALPARGKLGSDLRRLRDRGGLEFLSGLRITELRREGRQLSVEGLDAQGQAVHVAGIDEIICATGQRPDLTLTRELRLKLDPWLESAEALGPLIDPNLHSCGTVRPHGHRELAHPEAGFYAIGVKSYGRAPTFLMATGYEQARSVVAALDNDLAVADRVELDLPETGVCSVSTPVETTAGGGCCGGPAKADATACCALDEAKKAQGEAGCGCGAPKARVEPKVRCCG